MISSLYYLYFFLWRVCRASKDRQYGEFRVHSLLLMVEMMFGFGVMYAVLQDNVVEVSFLEGVLPLVAAPFALNLYLFSDERKLQPYFHRFSELKPGVRRAADLLATAFCLAAFALPFAVREILTNG